MVNEIHTEFYSTEFNRLLTRFYEYMRNGGCGIRTMPNATHARIECDPNGETVIRAAYSIRSNTIYCRRTTAAEVLDWLGWQLKKTVQKQLALMRLSVKDEWRRHNFNTKVLCFNSPTLSVYVGDAYYIYEALMNHKNINKKYSAALIKKWRGSQLDPIASEAERIRREEVARIEKEYAAKINECDYSGYRYCSDRATGSLSPALVEMSRKYQQLWNEFDEKARQLEDEVGGKWMREASRLRQEKLQKIKEVNDATKAMQMLNENVCSTAAVADED